MCFLSSFGFRVCLGDYHFLALLSNGQVLSWGSYSAGALGLGHPNHPHQRLLERPTQSDPSSQNEEHDVHGDRTTPTALQSFSGTEGDWETSGQKISRRYVFAITAAGWHSGCLAFGLDEDVDEDVGLGVLKQEVKDSPSQSRGSNLNPNGRLRFRIGYAGRFMGIGRGRGNLPGHAVLDTHGYAGGEEEDDDGEGVE